MASALFGTTGTSQELGPADTDPVAVGLARLMLGGFGLVVVAAVLGRLGPLRQASRSAALIGGVSVLCYQLAFFAGVRQSGVALGTVVTIGSGPVLAGLIAWLVLGERPQRRWWVSTTVAIVGITLIAGPSGSAPVAGIFLNLAAGLSYAVFATTSKRLLETLPAIGTMAVTFGLGAAMAAPMLVVVDRTGLASGPGVALVLWLGLAATTAAYIFYGYGLRTTPVGSAATLTLFEPVVATILGVLVLSERPSPIGWMGVVLVGVALMALIPRGDDYSQGGRPPFDPPPVLSRTDRVLGRGCRSQPVFSRHVRR